MKKSEFVLKPTINKNNNQINFCLKKSQLPKKIKSQLPKLKGINFKLKDMKFN